jgi:hypothetical protein
MSAEVFEGLTLISGRSASETLLINNNNDTLNVWNSIPIPNSICYLNPDSTLICPHLKLNADSQSDGGRYVKYDWYSNILWEYELPDSICLPHHDISLLPSGNILSICTEYKNINEVQNMGYVSEIDSLFGFDMILEIEPIGIDNANIIWEWKVSDHLIQDIDSNLQNYGIVVEHPELLDINMSTNSSTTLDWLHSNCVSYNEDLDQIVMSSRFSNEFYVIDHSTSVEEAVSHSGGLYGRGGDILYRWGNPQNYNRGTNTDQILGAQHGVVWIPQGYPGEGDFLLFNNQHEFYGPNNPNSKSAILEISPPINIDGTYDIINDNPFGPETPIWSYQDDFFSNFQSGTFRLPNGNTLITSSADELIFEISTSGDIELIHTGYNTARAIKYDVNYLTSNQNGDVNIDGVVNILDILLLVNFILTNEYNELSDLNSDGNVDVVDVIQLVNIILN